MLVMAFGISNLSDRIKSLEKRHYSRTTKTADFKKGISSTMVEDDFYGSIK